MDKSLSLKLEEGFFNYKLQIITNYELQNRGYLDEVTEFDYDGGSPDGWSKGIMGGERDEKGADGQAGYCRS